MELSIIIPAFNEEKRLGDTLESIKSFMDSKEFDYEVILVDDGSSDATSEIAKNTSLFKKGFLKILQNDGNRGKGYSVKRGVADSKGKYILFSDADLSTPISEFDKLMEGINKGADIVIGSRSIKTSKIEIRQPLYRQTMGRVFNLIIKCVLGEKFNDTQCGFKLFIGKAAKSLFDQLTVMGFAFDVEILFLARKNGFKVEERGVEWKNSSDSKVHPLRSSLEMLKDVLKIRLIHI